MNLMMLAGFEIRSLLTAKVAIFPKLFIGNTYPAIAAAADRRLGYK